MQKSVPIVRSIHALRRAVRGWRSGGEQVALVPTMGGLHEGHLSLVRAAHRHAPRVVASIFVNPTQFGPGEDFEAYPRREAEDAQMLSTVECDLIFAPPVTEMYAPGFATSVAVEGLTDVLCGANRPVHFGGVTTVVAKLLNQAQADHAIFGEKDWQQLVVIRRMVRDLDIPVAIHSAPTLREEDGLAMSSRNRYLSTDERRTAGKLNKALFGCADLIAQGNPVEQVLSACRQALVDAGFASIDYVEARRAHDLSAITEFDRSKPARLFAAAHLGRARLIDNVPIARPASSPHTAAPMG